MNLLKTFLTGHSKKLWVVLAASVLVMFKDYFSFSPDQVEALQIIAGSYLVGQGIADHQKSAAQVKLAAEKKEEKPVA